MKIRSLAFALLAVLDLAACRGSSSSTPDAPNGNNPDGTVNTDDVDIRDIQDPGNKVAVGAVVNVRGVVVTAIDNFGNKTGNFWIQEPSGAPEYSGVLVFKADVSQVATLAVGDLVDVTGASKSEFALASDTSGRTTTELEPPTGGAITVTKVGTGTVPTPAPVNALTIGMMATQQAQDAEWEKWEGVLIQVSNVGVISSTKTFGSTPGPDATEFTVTGNLIVESTLAAFPDTTMAGKGPQFGDCLGTVTGIGDYFFDWLLEPRATTEIATGGSNCPVAETGDTLCSDGLDNDGNGHADCGDYSCDLTVTSCVKGATVHDVDTSATNAPVGGAVNVDGVFVIAVDSGNQNLWVADSLAAAQSHGVEVFRGTGASTTTLSVGTVPGAKINVDLAAISPFHGLMELAKIPGATVASPNISVVTPPAGLPTALASDLATLSDATAVLPFVGSLVTISGGKFSVTAVTGTGKTKRYTLSDGTHNISMGGQIYDPNATTANCYSAITAIATLDTTPNPSVSMLLPIGATSMTATACN